MSFTGAVVGVKMMRPGVDDLRQEVKDVCPVRLKTNSNFKLRATAYNILRFICLP